MGRSKFPSEVRERAVRSKPPAIPILSGNTKLAVSGCGVARSRTPTSVVRPQACGLLS